MLVAYRANRIKRGIVIGIAMMTDMVSDDWTTTLIPTRHLEPAG
jgi:hypothetical protein